MDVDQGKKKSTNEHEFLLTIHFSHAFAQPHRVKILSAIHILSPATLPCSKKKRELSYFESQPISIHPILQTSPLETRSVT